MTLARQRKHTALAALAAAACSAGAAVGQDTAPPPSPVPDNSEQSQPATAPPEQTMTAPTEPVTTAPPVIVTATRREQSVLDVPASVNIVTARQIEEALYRTTPEALRDIPGIMVQKTAQGQGSPYIRGFTGFRTLMLIDGIRLNNSTFREGPNQYWNTVDPYSLSRLEVVKGPSSVLYGSDAVGGTVNALTISPPVGDTGFDLGGRAFTRLSTAERSYTLRGEVNTTVEDSLGVHVGATYKDFGDLRSGAGKLPQTGYDEFDIDFKAEFRINPDLRLVLAHQRVDIDDAWRTHSTIFARPFEGSAVGSDRRRSLNQERDLTYAQLHAENMDSFIDAARFSVSYHSQAETEFRIRSNGRSDHQGVDVDTLGAWAQFETDSVIGYWTYGAEYYHDSVDSFRTDYNVNGTVNAIGIQGPVADDSRYDLVGIYIQNDIPFGDALNLVLGGRYTYASADADKVADPTTGDQTSISEDFDSFVGSARLIYRIDPQEHWRVFGGVSQAFRAPNLSDLTRLDTARSDELETPSPGLDPEQFISYEVGLRADYERLSAQVAYFYTDIDDMIIRQPTGVVIGNLREVTKRNSGSGYVQGVEFGANWEFYTDFSLFGSFAWMEGEVDSFPTSAPVMVREPISRIMPLTTQVGLRWDAPDRRVWVEGLVTIATDADKLNAADRADTQRIPPGGTPGYTTLAVRTGWQVTSNLAMTLTLDNLTDEDYRIHGSGVNEPGVNLIFGLDYRF